MKLKLGKMTSKEIAEWLGISYNSYKNHVDKHLQKLNTFASYTKVYGGVIIDEIYISEYDKTLDERIDKIFIEEVMTAKDNLTTIAGLARKYADAEQMSEKQLSRVFAKSRNKLFGAIVKDNLKASGLIGSREVVWAIKVNNYNSYRFLTPEEDNIFDLLISKVYGNLNPKTIKGAALLEKVFENSDMTKEQYLAIKNNSGFNFFTIVIAGFKEATGLQLVHANLYEIDLGYDYTEIQTDQEYKKKLEGIIETIKEELKQQQQKEESCAESL